MDEDDSYVILGLVISVLQNQNKRKKSWNWDI